MWERLRSVRDVAYWGVGLVWGDHLIRSDLPGDPWKIQLVAMLLGLPFVLRGDERRRQQKAADAASLNGLEDGARQPET